jgi:predicted enzyme related to lactoylglutathione lyase
VADVDATLAKAKAKGGRAYVEPMDVPKVGRIAVLGDPQGAPMAIVKPIEPMALHDDGKHGEFSWCELLTTDHESAFRFYSELFGWSKLADHDMGPMGKYLIYGIEGRRLGGMFTKPKDMPMPPSWLYYVHVDDLDGAIARAKAKGAKVMNGPMEVPDGSFIAQLMDPQGAAFALHASPKK